tara:strand:+ start:272 stop:1270 length:999 start_codon:yes stop_codon:yes gene_type:complete
VINYFTVVILLLLFLFVQYNILYYLNFKIFFLKQKLINRWSNDDCYLVGGIIFISAIVFLQYLNYYFIKFNFFSNLDVFILILFYCFGFYDDKYNITGKFKLLIYFLIIVFLTYIYLFENLNINYLYILFLAIILFIIFVSLSIIDNIDGLLTSNFIIIILFFSILFFVSENYNHLFFLLCILIISSFFLFINLLKLNNYLGDSGSNVLACVLIIIFLKLNSLNIISNTLNFKNIIFLVGIFSYPLFDIIYVFCYRILNGISPLQGGADHSSHILTIFFKSKYKMLLVISILNLLILIISYFVFLNLLNIFYYLAILSSVYFFLFMFILKNK